jgi:hypothetical protein
MPPDPQFVLVISAWGHLRHLGGLGLVLLGIADSSVIPLTGSMDALTIYLAALHRDLWPFYALMATIGAMIGGYLTYSLAREGGKEVMAYKLSPAKAAQVSRAFERRGIGAGDFASAVSHSAVPVGRGGSAVLTQEVPRGACSGTGDAVHHCRRSGRTLRRPYRGILLPVLQAHAGPADRSSRCGDGGDAAQALARPARKSGSRELNWRIFPSGRLNCHFFQPMTL